MPGVDQPDRELQLIQEAIAGDKQAFGRLYDCYADQIFRYLYFRVEERSMAIDMTEDVFLKAWEKIPQFGKDRRGLNFRAWLYRIAHNTVIDYYRTNKVEVSLDEVSEYHDKMPAAIQLIEESEEIQELMGSLEKLDEISRQVIVLRFYSGLNPKEISQVMNLSEGNVRVIQYRSLKRIREIMGASDER